MQKIVKRPCLVICGSTAIIVTWIYCITHIFCCLHKQMEHERITKGKMTPALVKRGFTCHTFSANSKVPDLPHTRRSHQGKYNLRRHGCPYHKFHFLLLYRRFRPRLRCCANRTGLPSGNQVYGTCPEATRWRMQICLRLWSWLFGLFTLPPTHQMRCGLRYEHLH